MIYTVNIASQNRRYLVEADSADEAANNAIARADLAIVVTEANDTEKEIFNKRDEYTPIGHTIITKGV